MPNIVDSDIIKSLANTNAGFGILNLGQMA